MLRRVGMLTAIVLVAACCSKDQPREPAGPTSPVRDAKPTFTLFALAEMRGQIGPCGCTSDPLGDISRTAQLIADARARGPVLVVDAGSLLYSRSPVPPQMDAQEDLKADFLVKTYAGALGVAAVGLGPADLAKGAGHVRTPRQAVNLADEKIPVEAPKIMTVGGAKVGVFGVIAKDAVKDLPIKDPVAAGKQAVAQLKAQGAQVVVGLVQASSRRDAAQLARDIGGIDFAVAGLGLEAPEPDRIDAQAQKLGDGWLVVPANRGQVLARVDVTVRGTGIFADAGGAGAAETRIAAIDKQLKAIDADLASFAKDPSAEKGFVAQKKAERESLAATRDRLKNHPLDAPKDGSYFTFAQIVINKGLSCSVEVQDGVKAYDRAAGEANVKAAAMIPVPQPERGKPGYVGMEACADCHQDAVDFWKHTIHASAWKTLEDRGQQFDFECIGCHVTGWDRPGGSNLGHNENLRDVQCETCHGPGSIHVAKGGKEKPFAIAKSPAKDLCASQCHTKEHSDTFALEPYLRDITGPGHGEDRRKQLGDGPTGHALRAAALEQAGSSLGARCTR